MQFSTLDGRKYDVIVCGAGSAGVAAACSAARLGAQTLLLERHAYGGGIVTAAMIHTFDAIKSCADNSVSIVAGFASELLAEISRLGGDATADNPPEALTIHPEIGKIAVDNLLARHGVAVLWHAPVVEALMDGGRVAGVEAALRDGRARFHAPVVVDGTGDAQIAFFAGAPWTLDRELQALTSHFRLGGVAPGVTWDGWEAITRKAMEEARAAGEVGVYGGPWVIRLNDGEISLNTTRVFADPNDPARLSAAETAGRAQMLATWNSLRRRCPELRDSHIISGNSQLHIRESRIIDGEYRLTEEDIREGRRFPDAIAIGAWPVDIHPSDGKVGVHPHKESPPLPYEIPYRVMVPKNTDGLLVPGKAISTTHRAHGSTRVPGTSLATGQAAGVAAALSARTGAPPRFLDTGELRHLLRSQGAIVSVAD
ncbi:MAG: FAD-dependent oxidoreductase [Opitutaceae bacterium]|jgi:glycine/D-amino acid oxidase-like deaminating enzyme|nr:FAD-dependent oxidoreductase [Opitutaceae bacterium]